MNPCTVDQLWQLIDEQACPLSPRPVPLDDALGCVLADLVSAPADQPAFDRSSIDGFAVPDGAPCGEFKLIGEILPGDSDAVPPAVGECWRVFTGSAIPAGCALVMQEDAAVHGGSVQLRVAPSTSLVRRRGSSVRQGQVLVPSGTSLRAGEIALLASAGCAVPRVFPRPRVVHVTTGREIVPCRSEPKRGQVRDVNGPLVSALLRAAGATQIARYHVDEQTTALTEVVERAGEFNVLLVSGGSSVGRYDNSRGALEAMGFTVLVERVNSRPGKPLVVARRGAQWAFGLPGNPVAHYVMFHVFIARALARLAGRSTGVERAARLAAGCEPSGDVRETFWPAKFVAGADGREVALRRWIDSGDVAALAGVDALVRIPTGQTPQAGDTVACVPCGGPDAFFP